MSNPKFYEELLDRGHDNNSDVSEIGPEDLASIVKGVDDMDDALFGFKTKQQDQQRDKTLLIGDQKKVELPKSAIKEHANDLPEGDLLADISLSDDDFYDLGKNNAMENRDKTLPTTPKKLSQDKLLKSKKIANLFGLDNEDDVSDNKKKQESAGDWLGIIDSPVKTKLNISKQNKPETDIEKKSMIDSLGSEKIVETKTLVDSKKSEQRDITTTPNISTNFRETESVSVPAPNLNNDKRSESNKVGTVSYRDNIFDMLEDRERPKTSENVKEKKSTVFDELFGDSNLGQIKSSRRNSAVKSTENIANKSGSTTVIDDNSVRPGHYIPSATTARRPGLGRRRETNLPPTTPPSSLLFQEDWLASSTNKDKKDRVQLSKPEENTPAEIHGNLPSWLGGSGDLQGRKPTQSQQKPLKQDSAEDKEAVKKQDPETSLHTSNYQKEPESKFTKDPEAQIVDTARQVLSNSMGHSEQIGLSLQRTEAQLVAALEIQTTQSSLTAVCERQRSILDSQEKQLSQLIRQQVDRQAQVEQQLTSQQERIHQLLEVLTINLSPSTAGTVPNLKPDKSVSEKEQYNETTRNYEWEIQKITLENEELKQRIKLTEKHYNMEIESLKLLHRKEIESWEDQFARKNELSDILSNDFKEKIARLKENEAELISQHNERVHRLREERAEDMLQLMQFHKMTLEQVSVLGKFLTPVRQELKLVPETRSLLDTDQLSEKEEELIKKEKILSALQAKLEVQRDNAEKQLEETEAKIAQENMKNEEIAKQLKQEQYQLKYKQQQLNQEKKHMEEQHYLQNKMLEEMREKVMSEQTNLATEKLMLAEERAKLDALAKLQGVSGMASFDELQAKAEVAGALEVARAAELQAVEERRKLKDKERALDNHHWKLKEMEDDLVARAHHVDKLLQVSQANQETGHQALEEAKQLEKRAEEKLQEVERRKTELKEKEQSLIRLKLDIAQEEIRINRKRQQLEHILPQLSSDEVITLHPIKDVIDPKKLIMKLRAEREFEAVSNYQPQLLGNQTSQ